MTELHHLGLAALGRKLDAGEVTSRQLTDHFLGRVAQHNEALGAFLHVDAEAARAQADAADARRAQGGRRRTRGAGRRRGHRAPGRAPAARPRDGPAGLPRHQRPLEPARPERRVSVGHDSQCRNRCRRATGIVRLRGGCW